MSGYIVSQLPTPQLVLSSTTPWGKKLNDQKEKERLAKQKLDEEKIAKQKLDEELLVKKRLDEEKIAKQKLDEEKIAKQKLDEERLLKQKLDEERLLKQKLDEERLAKQKMEKERLAKQRLNEERLAKERLAKQKEIERKESERLNEEKIEIERIRSEQIERIRANQLEIERKESERLLKEQMEIERIRSEQIEIIRQKAENDRLLYETIEKQRKELEKQILEKERIDIRELEDANTNLIDMGHDNIELFITKLFNAVNYREIYGEVMFPLLNTKEALNISILGKVDYYKSVPSMYISGGSAYRAYNKYISTLLGIKESSIAYPRTIDYDLTMCLRELNEYTILDLIDYFKDFIRTYYIILNQNNYIKSNFKEVTNKEVDPGNKDKYKYIYFGSDIYEIKQFETYIWDYMGIVLTLYQHPSYSYNVSFRISVMPNKGSPKMERIIDILLTTEPSVYKKVPILTILNLNNSQLWLANVNSLLQMTLNAIIYRGNDMTNYNKCRKDVYRLTYFFSLLNRVPVRLLANIGYTQPIYYDIFNYIISILKHCKSKINREEIYINYFKKLKDLEATTTTNFNKYEGTLVQLLLKLVANPSQFKVLKKEIDTYLLTNNINEEMVIKQKYLKYKQKYIMLKNIIN